MPQEGTFFNIQRYSIHDGPGIRSIIFMKGCPLDCPWCANPESQLPYPQVLYTAKDCKHCGICVQTCPVNAITVSQRFGLKIDYDKCRNCGACIEECIPGALKIAGKQTTVDQAIQEIMKDSSFFRRGGGITLSGGESLMQIDFVEKLLCRFHDLCIHTAVETCGEVPFNYLERIAPYCNLFLYDIKQMDSQKHKIMMGMGNERILSNLEKMKSFQSKIWIRMPIIPGYNDDFEDVIQVASIANRLSNVEKIELLPYHKFGMGKYAQLGRRYPVQQEVAPPSCETMEQLCEGIRQRLTRTDCEVEAGQ